MVAWHATETLWSIFVESAPKDYSSSLIEEPIKHRPIHS